MPTAMERLVWGMGDGSTMPVFDTPIGKIGAVIISPFVKPGSSDSQPYNHYSLLRSLETLFGIKQHLGYADKPDPGEFGTDVYSQ